VIVAPGEGIERFLVKVDARMREINGTHLTETVQAEMAVAQVAATCALVHAVRELTAEVRELTGGADGGSAG
jgi:hypothetical protein